jgi:hypothetical protein
LKEMTFEIEVPPDIIVAARDSIRKMLEY